VQHFPASQHHGDAGACPEALKEFEFSLEVLKYNSLNNGVIISKEGLKIYVV